ncbi:MAG: hypothetical protein EA350_03360 [Gemmatimonadales bacterium]|nr:MAG: hypothetical protein EA350_03360 [Gemmatimonadales bacterium]
MLNRRLALLGLFAGFAGGILISLQDAPALDAVVGWITPVGTLWINALRMVVIPLVVSLLVVGVASLADLAAVRRIGSTALGVWIGLLLVSGGLGLTLIPLLFSWLTIDPVATTVLRESAATLASSTAQGLERMPTFSAWLVDLVPVNPIGAAADGAMLPLVVFSVVFGLAITRLSPGHQAALLTPFRAAAEAMLVIVGWVLYFTPAGVFALALGVASQVGLTAVGAVGYYLVVTSVSMVLLMVVIFAVTVVAGRISPANLARALLPALVIGFTSRSSLASLPAQAEAATHQLRLPTHAAGFVLPLAVATFKPHGPLNWSTLAIFSALLYGIPMGPAEILTVVISAILLSFAVPGIPSAGMLLIAPVFVGIGIPVEAVGILIAVDAIPDMFKTVANITGQFSSTVIVARLTGGGRPEEPPPGGPDAPPAEEAGAMAEAASRGGSLAGSPG